MERYRHYLIVERGLDVRTARGYVDAVRPFVAGRSGVDGLDLAGLAAADVTAFALTACPGRAVGSAKMLVTGLRRCWASCTSIHSAQTWPPATTPMLRHEALLFRMGVRDPRRSAVVAVG